MESSPVRKTLAATTIGTVIHSIACPLHGLPGLLLKAGLLPAATLGPFQRAHEYVAEQLVPLFEPFAQNHEQAHHIAHATIDYGSWALVVVPPAVLVGNYLVRRRKHNHAECSTAPQHDKSSSIGRSSTYQ